MTYATKRQAKTAVKAQRSVHVTEQRKRERRCFWTWPLGHIWRRTTSGEIQRCVWCGKESDFRDLGY